MGPTLSALYYTSLHLGAVVCLLLTALGTQQTYLFVSMGIAAIGGALLSIGIHRNRGAALNVYLARTAALELITGVSIVGALSL